MNQDQSTRRNFIRTMAAAASCVAAPSLLPRFAWGETAASGWDLGPFVKRKEPVLQPTPESVFTCPIRGTDIRWEEQNTYNPATVVRGGKVYLLYRTDDRSPDLRWGRTCRIGLAHSEDGVHFTRNTKTVLKEQKELFLWPEYDWEKKGFVANTTVANGLVPFRGKWMLYYGGADRVIGLATCGDEERSRM